MEGPSDIVDKQLEETNNKSESALKETSEIRTTDACVDNISEDASITRE
jgi:hypothetical protein